MLPVSPYLQCCLAPCILHVHLHASFHQRTRHLRMPTSCSRVQGQALVAAVVLGAKLKQTWVTGQQRLYAISMSTCVRSSVNCYSRNQWLPSGSLQCMDPAASCMGRGSCVSDTVILGLPCKMLVAGSYDQGAT